MQLKTTQVLLHSSVICPLKELNIEIIFFCELSENNTQTNNLRCGYTEVNISSIPKTCPEHESVE